MPFITDRPFSSNAVNFRADHRYYHTPGGNIMGVPNSHKASIQMDHIDGPLLHQSDCGMHWLTYFERFQLRFGFTDVEKLDKKYADTPVSI